MAVALQRVRSGLLYWNDFDDGPVVDTGLLRWSFEPDDSTRWSLIERPGYLRLKHGPDPISLLTTTDGLDRLVVEVRNDYIPGRPEDRGGLVAIHTAGHSFALLEEYDQGDPSAWPWLRMVMDRGAYSGYGSHDGRTWRLIGSGRLRGEGVMGITLEGLDLPGASPYDVDWIAAYRSLDITVGRVTTGSTVELWSESGMLVSSVYVRTGPAVAIRPPGPAYPFRGRLVIRQFGQIIAQSDLLDLWGGDEFLPTEGLQIEWDGRVLGADVPTDLGYVTNQGLEVALTLRNVGGQTYSAVEVRVEADEDDIGWEWVRLATDAGGVPGDYGQGPIILPNVRPGDARPFWLLIQRTEDPRFWQLMGQARFRLTATPVGG